jgi:hypothetical protein
VSRPSITDKTERRQLDKEKRERHVSLEPSLDGGSAVDVE